MKNTDLDRTVLSQLLSENSKAADKRAIDTFDQITADENDAIVFVGAGGLLRKILTHPICKNLPIVAITDNDAKKWQTEINGIKVLPPAEVAKKWGKTATFIVSIWSPQKPFIQFREQFKKLGCVCIVPSHMFFWKYHMEYLPYYSQGLPSDILIHGEALLKIFDQLADIESQKLFTAYIKHRLSLDFDILPEPDLRNEYFPKGIITLDKDEVFVDIGAFDGDSIRSFEFHSKNNYGQIIAFEPDPENFNKLKTMYGNDKKITLYQSAVTDKDSWLQFDATSGVGSAVTEKGMQKVKAVALDSVLKNTRISYVKMDIEGSELLALQGSKKILYTQRPKIAVCLYHKPEDIFEIPEYLMRTSENYNFYIRSHDYDGIQLVLYAIPLTKQK